MLVTALIASLTVTVSCQSDPRPHIVFILADDLGYGDVGWNNGRMSDVTKRLAKIASKGVTLSQYYVQPVCTPSRSALMTGMYPYHIGRQKGTIKPLQPTGLTLDKTLLSERLQALGYRTHVVGKWHLGFCSDKFTPTNRGFDSFRGFYLGAEDYFNHKRSGFYDFRRDKVVDKTVAGRYSTDIITREAVTIIDEHVSGHSDQPLFLYLPYQAVHGPLEAPRSEMARVRKSSSNQPRDIYRAMMSRLDRGVAGIVNKLKKEGMWNNTILVFSTDNGGAVSQAGSNYPLRGTKGTLFQGGTHGVGFVSGGLIPTKRRGATSDQLTHITDWYPTLLSAAGADSNVTSHDDLDGVDQWPSIVRGAPTTRDTMVYNLKILPVQGAIRVGDYKLMFAPQFNKDGWYDPDSAGLPTFPPKRRGSDYSAADASALHKPFYPVFISKERVALKKKEIAENIFNITVEEEQDDEDEDIRAEVKLLQMMSRNRGGRDDVDYQEIFDKRWPDLKKHLFNVVLDPEERNDLKDSEPGILEDMRKVARHFYGSFVERDYPDKTKRGSPKNFRGVWSSGWCHPRSRKSGS